jgi:glycosyltransferase involved in cell wall biosynthesis
MKNILVIFTTGFNPYGGLTTVMMNYWRAMDTSGLHFDFACTNNPRQDLLDEIQAAGCKYIKLPPRKKIFAYYRALRKLSSEYDIAHIHGNSSTSYIELAALSKVSKRIIHNHNSITEHPIINAILHPFFLRSYTQAVACSTLAGEWLFGKGKFAILRNAINVDRFTPNDNVRKEYRSYFAISDDELVIGNVGKIIKQKNHTFIIDVFFELHKQFPKSKLLLVGAGNLEPEIKSKIEIMHLKDCVIMAGLRTDIPKLMSAMDVFLFPSLWEGLPLSVLEAQASGLPVFLSDIISSEVVISPNCHSLSLTQSPAEWAKYILDNTNTRNRKEDALVNKKALTDAGYNISAEAHKLREMYFEKN